MSPSFLFLNRDAKILDLIRKGDEQGLVLLFEDTRSMVVSYVTRNKGSVDDGEEMLQDALVILWERVRRGTFQYEAKLSTFIFGVVRNLWRRRLAKSRRESPGLDDLDPPDEGASALDGLIQAEEADLVRKAMGRIGEQCRKILLMFYWEERSMEDIAGELGFANTDTAKSKKYQCKKSLEKELALLMSNG